MLVLYFSVVEQVKLSNQEKPSKKHLKNINGNSALSYMRIPDGF